MSHERRDALIKIGVRLSLWLVFSCVALVMHPSIADASPIGTFFNEIQKKWDPNDPGSLIHPMFERSLDVGKRLFGAVVVAEISWLAFVGFFSGNLFAEAYGQFGRLLLRTVAQYVLILKAGFFIGLIATGFSQAGAYVAGFTPAANSPCNITATSPGSLADCGITVAGRLANPFSAPPDPNENKPGWNAWALDKVNLIKQAQQFMAAISNVFYDLLLVPVMILILGDFVMLGAMEAFAYVEWGIIGLGVFMLGFLPGRWFTQYAMGLINYAFSTGLRLFVIIAIGGLAAAVTGQFVDLIIVHNAQDNVGATLQDILTCYALSIFLAYVVFQVPAITKSIITGANAMELGPMLGAAIGTAITAVAAVASGGTSAAIQAAGKAAEAGGGAAGTGAAFTSKEAGGAGASGAPAAGGMKEPEPGGLHMADGGRGERGIHLPDGGFHSVNEPDVGAGAGEGAQESGGAERVPEPAFAAAESLAKKTPAFDIRAPLAHIAREMTEQKGMYNAFDRAKQTNKDFWSHYGHNGAALSTRVGSDH